MLSQKQQTFVKAAISRKYRFLLYGGGVAGGKTIVTLGFVDEMAQQYPGTRYVVVRKSLTTLRRNTLPSYRKILAMNGNPSRAILHKGEWTYFYKNGSEVLFMEADISNDPELNKLRGLEITIAVMEEANECARKAFDILITRTGRWMNKEYNIPPLILLSCNPDNNWVKDVFYDPWSRNALKAPFYFLQALPHDNPHNTKEYLQSLEYLPKAEYERYVKGNWDYAGDPNQLIPYLWYKPCVVTEFDDYTKVPLYIGIDVAREGDDSSTFTFWDEKSLLFIRSYKYDKCNPLRDRLLEAMEEFKIPEYSVMVDGIGLGASLIDLCAEKNVYIEVFKSSFTGKNDYNDVGLSLFTFRNKRAEAHWLYRVCIERGEIDLIDDYELQRQSMALKYIEDARCITIEDKKMIKKRLGYSPDTAEAAIIGNYLRVLRGNSISLVPTSTGKSTKTAATLVVMTNEDDPRTITAKELVY